MKKFFDAIFLSNNEYKEKLEYPIKLEYYQTIETRQQNEARYGVEIIKTEYKNKNINVENGIINNLTNNLEELYGILNILKNNKVTPIGMKDVLIDIFVD